MAEGKDHRLALTKKDENVKLRRTGPGLDKIRKAHRTLREVRASSHSAAVPSQRPRVPLFVIVCLLVWQLILTKYDSLYVAFKEIDADGSGKLRRAELRAFLHSMDKRIPDQVLSGLIDYVDSDADSKTITLDEFVELMAKEHLD